MRVRRDRLGGALKLMVLTVALWWIWAPVLAAAGILAVIAIG